MGISKIDWPGPVPYRFDDKAPAERKALALIGRNDAFEELRAGVSSAFVVEITAPSGVGKTSFVNAMKPYLESVGSRVMVEQSRPWPAALGQLDRPDDVAALYCLALGQELTPEDGIVGMLKSLAGDRLLICVFDQFEELLRYHRQLGIRLLELIRATAEDASSPHVVVARSEFRDALRPTAGSLRRPPKSWDIYLQEITDPAVIRRIVEEPARHAEVAIDEAAIDRIADWWQSARESRAGAAHSDEFEYRGSSNFGLLHLQALLHGFKGWAASAIGADGTHVTLDDVEAYAAQLTPAPQDGARVLAAAMFEHVASAAGGKIGAEWPNGPRLMTARVARYLSSAGYKVPQATSSLTPLALQEELPSSVDAQRLSHRLWRASTAEEWRDALADVHVPIEPAGIAVDWAHSNVAAAMTDSLVDGLEHLADTDNVNVLRKFSQGQDAIYELVHDGVGDALNAWADSFFEDPVAVIGVIAARNGQPMRHDLRAELFLDDTGEVDPRWGKVRRGSDGRIIISNLKWIGNSVGRTAPSDADPDNRGLEDTLQSRGGLILEDLTFENCIFRGSAFIGVVLKNVTFDDCVFQGVAMLGCAFDNVHFNGAPEDGLDTLTIHNAWPAANVRFSDIDHVQGLFMTSVHGGAWTFENVQAEHFVISSKSEEPLALHFIGTSHIIHATVQATAAERPVVEDGIIIWPRSDPDQLLEGRALPPGE